MRQSLQFVAQPRLGLLVVDLRGFDQAVDLCFLRSSIAQGRYPFWFQATEYSKRSINPTFKRWESMAILEFAACSSTAAKLQSLLRSRLVVGAQVHGAATHRALGRWL
ncbi:hypothetical protein D9M68_939200 [compost metagenome]